MKVLSLIGLTSLFFLAACATGYQRLGFTGGYSETQLAPNIFRVSFRGNGYTGEDEAADFALLRAAEVTTEHGYKYFILGDSEKSTKLSSYTTPTTSHTTASAYGYGNHAYGQAQTTTSGGETYFIAKPRSSNTIVCFETKPEVNGLVFEAAFLAQALRKQYRIGGGEPASMAPSCRVDERLVNGICRAIIPGQ